MLMGKVIIAKVPCSSRCFSSILTQRTPCSGKQRQSPVKPMVCQWFIGKQEQPVVLLSEFCSVLPGAGGNHQPRMARTYSKGN